MLEKHFTCERIIKVFHVENLGQRPKLKIFFRFFKIRLDRIKELKKVI